MEHAKYPLPFERLWKVYPRKVGKESALKTWQSARKRVEPQTILAGAERLAADPNLPDAQFIPHLATWLKRGGWDDEPCPSRNGHNGPSRFDENVDAVRRMQHREESLRNSQALEIGTGR